MMGVVLDSASEYLVLVGAPHWLDGCVTVLGGVFALKTQLESTSSRLMQQGQRRADTGECRPMVCENVWVVWWWVFF